jgi:hypothetical protein
MEGYGWFTRFYAWAHWWTWTVGRVMWSIPVPSKAVFCREERHLQLVMPLKRRKCTASWFLLWNIVKMIWLVHSAMCLCSFDSVELPQFQNISCFNLFSISRCFLVCRFTHFAFNLYIKRCLDTYMSEKAKTYYIFETKWVCGSVAAAEGFHQRKRRWHLYADRASPHKASLLVWATAASSPSCFAGSSDLCGGVDRVEAAVGGGHW